MRNPMNDELNYFRFKQIHSDRYLLTNDVGSHLFLNGDEFAVLRSDPTRLSGPLRARLLDKGFLFEDGEIDGFIKEYRTKHDFLHRGPGLHILVVTLRCNHTCSYCQAGRKGMEIKNFDMDPKTAEETVDFILSSGAQDLCIEFQGGEPLVNFDTVRHVIEYTQSRNTDKNIIFSIVTNLSLMDDQTLSFLLENDVAICTSLDGPEEIHNKHRVLTSGNSYRKTVDQIRRISAELDKKDREGKTYGRLNALPTISKDILSDHKSLVDLYVELGFQTIHLRPVNPFGFSEGHMNGSQYPAKEFLKFYRRCLDYILELNESGTVFLEKTALIFLQKILTRTDPGFMDIRSPCGAGIGQLAYNYDGRIFTCDEGRMVDASGDDVFCLGNVSSSSYPEVVTNGVVRCLSIASCLEGLPGCHDCVYHPYCGVCPVYNYVVHGNIFGRPFNERCQIMSGIQDYIFERLEEKFDIFSSWVTLSNRTPPGKL
ncbi:His-Xaa-Ser system radical SAM maturase HxsB [Desulfobacter sp.]|uniref:His-Xaa-Ser system radical SAM maturase HxsB n=1 Tax=Desulfobacter sp. TaxID=2294 RepID=UPI003D0E9BA1